MRGEQQLGEATVQQLEKVHVQQLGEVAVVGLVQQRLSAVVLLKLHWWWFGGVAVMAAAVVVAVAQTHMMQVEVGVWARWRRVFALASAQLSSSVPWSLPKTG